MGWMGRGRVLGRERGLGRFGRLSSLFYYFISVLVGLGYVAIGVDIYIERVEREEKGMEALMCLEG